jgi:hypothetical protein
MAISHVIVEYASVNDVEMPSLEACENPLCASRFQPSETCMQKRHFYCDRCRLDSWVLGRAARLLSPLGEEGAWEVLNMAARKKAR